MFSLKSCTEMVMPICANGLTDMFEPQAWNFTSISEECKRQWQTTPRENWITTEYWGKAIEGASNIIFRYIDFFNPFLNKPMVLHVCSTLLLEKL